MSQTVLVGVHQTYPLRTVDSGKRTDGSTGSHGHRWGHVDGTVSETSDCTVVLRRGPELFVVLSRNVQDRGSEGLKSLYKPPVVGTTTIVSPTVESLLGPRGLTKYESKDYSTNTNLLFVRFPLPLPLVRLRLRPFLFL